MTLPGWLAWPLVIALLLGFVAYVRNEQRLSWRAAAWAAAGFLLAEVVLQLAAARH